MQVDTAEFERISAAAARVGDLQGTIAELAIRVERESEYGAMLARAGGAWTGPRHARPRHLRVVRDGDR